MYVREMLFQHAGFGLLKTDRKIGILGVVGSIKAV